LATLQGIMTIQDAGPPALEEPRLADGPGSDVARAAAGDRAALRRVLTRLAPVVLSAARRVLGSQAARGHDAEDVTQETLMAVTRKLPELRDPAAARAYARRTAARRALRLRRDADRDRDRLGTVAAQRAGRGDLSREALARGRADLLLGLMQDLSEVQAETMVLRYCLGMSLQEVADTMETSPNTVRSRIRLARERLVQEIDERPELRAALEGA
jgi:RNA polymerase sigma-70 factor (ECF subfamily)